MRFGAYTEIKNREGMDFGCLTSGFPDTETGVRTLDMPFECKVFGGSYADAEAFVKETGKDACAAVVVTDGAGGENESIRRISGLLDCPVVGGGAARPFGRPGDGLFSKAGQAEICLLFGRASLTAETENIHEHILGECTLTIGDFAGDPRILKTINGEDAAQFLKKEKERLGFSARDFEHLTLSTLTGINAHMREENGVIYSGRDLEEKMILRYVLPEEVQEKTERFYRADENAVVFGCAGLRGILPARFDCGAFGMFLYGEICVTGEKNSEFGNLMLSKIRW